MLSGCHKEYAEFLCLKEVNAFYCLLSSSDSLKILTKDGGGSPCQNLTFLKNISLVSLPKSNLTIIN